jgi:hypothetical protein
MECMKIYVAGPYTGSTMEEIEENVWRAIEAGLRIWKKGHYPYIPHLTHWPDQYAKEQNIPMDWSDYMKWHAPWVDYCDALFLLAESKGAGKPVFYSLDEIPTVDRSSNWADDHIEK